MESVKDDNKCFACGKNNPIGLKLDFGAEGKIVFSEVVFNENYEGWNGIVHGGILSTALDEVMIKVANNSGLTCVTAELKVRFRKPCLTGKKYRLEGSVSDVKKNLVLTEGRIIDMEGKTVVSSIGKLFVVAPDKNSVI